MVCNCCSIQAKVLWHAGLSSSLKPAPVHKAQSSASMLQFQDSIMAVRLCGVPLMWLEVRAEAFKRTRPGLSRCGTSRIPVREAPFDLFVAIAARAPAQCSLLFDLMQEKLIWLRRVMSRRGLSSVKSLHSTLPCSMCCWQSTSSYSCRFRSPLPQTVACRLWVERCFLNGQSKMDQGLICVSAREFWCSARVGSVTFLSNVCAHGDLKSQ